MKKIIASMLAIIFILSSIAGVPTTALAAEPEDTARIETLTEEEITTDSVFEPGSAVSSDEFEAEEIEAAEVPGPADIQEEEEAPSAFDVPEDESSLSDALVPE
jgi:hypothetical protein